MLHKSHAQLLVLEIFEGHFIVNSLAPNEGQVDVVHLESIPCCLDRVHNLPMPPGFRAYVGIPRGSHDLVVESIIWQL